MTDPKREEHLIHTRPADWDGKYGPWGTPPDYTPPMTATNNIQSPLGLRIGGVFFAAFFIAGVAGWFLLANSGEPITGKIVFGLFIMVGVCAYMTWWCFHLANRRAKWLRANTQHLEHQQEPTKGRP